MAEIFTNFTVYYYKKTSNTIKCVLAAVVPETRRLVAEVEHVPAAIETAWSCVLECKAHLSSLVVPPPRSAVWCHYLLLEPTPHWLLYNSVKSQNTQISITRHNTCTIYRHILHFKCKTVALQ